jgi:hypothetical protein
MRRAVSTAAFHGYFPGRATLCLRLLDAGSRGAYIGSCAAAAQVGRTTGPHTACGTAFAAVRVRQDLLPKQT